MMHILLTSFMMLLSIIFIQISHPLAMGLMLLIQTVVICMITGLLSKTFWFSYILFLVFLGGMLVLFIYVTSLASNEMFSLSSKLIMNSIIWIMLTSLAILLIDKTSIYPFLLNNDMKSITEMNFITENSLTLNKLYNFPNNMVTLLLMNYLLITLIAVVKITKLFSGPLRPMN